MVVSKDRAKSANYTLEYRLCSGSVNAAVNAAVKEASNMLRARDDEGQGILKPMLRRFALRFPIWASSELAILARRYRFLVHEAVIGHPLRLRESILVSKFKIALPYSSIGRADEPWLYCFFHDQSIGRLGDMKNAFELKGDVE